MKIKQSHRSVLETPLEQRTVKKLRYRQKPNALNGFSTMKSKERKLNTALQYEMSEMESSR